MPKYEGFTPAGDRVPGQLSTYVATQERFRALSSQWRQATRFLSADEDIAMHPAYQQIIGMGAKILPSILGELAARLDHWFWALEAIAGESPVDPNDAGDLERMRNAWLEWGHAKGLIA